MNKKTESMTVSDTSMITIPVRNLIALFIFVGLAITGYFNVTGRITFLEHNLAIQDVHITNDLRVGGATTFTGNVTFNGGTIGLGDSVTDNVVFNEDIGSSSHPAVSKIDNNINFFILILYYICKLNMVSQ